LGDEDNCATLSGIGNVDDAVSEDVNIPWSLRVITANTAYITMVPSASVVFLSSDEGVRKRKYFDKVIW